MVFESSQVNDDCTILPSNHKKTCKNGWSHLLSSHRFMLSVFEDRSVFTGQNGMLVGLYLRLSSLRKKKKHVHFLSRCHRSKYFPVWGLSFTPNFIYFSNASLLCSFSFQIVQTFLALRKAVGKGSLLTHLFPVNRSPENWQLFVNSCPLC